MTTLLCSKNRRDIYHVSPCDGCLLDQKLSHLSPALRMRERESKEKGGEREEEKEMDGERVSNKDQRIDEGESKGVME